MASSTIRLTVAQAIIRFLSVQYSERDGNRQRLIPAIHGIFGHGNVAGLGQAILQNQQAPAEGEEHLEYYQGRNEQNMVHAAVAYARTKNRLQAHAVTASIGPGSTNMITGAALATIDRIPVLLFPSDIFSTRRVDPVLQQLEDERGLDLSVNDAFKPVSRFFDRINRPEQVMSSLLAAMRVLTDPAETGAVTIALPQDVQAEAYDFPAEFFAPRTWYVARPVPEPAALERAAQAIALAKAPLIVSGGGVIYSDASAALVAFAEKTGIPVADTQAGKGAIPFDHPLCVGGVGSTGNNAANTLAAEADLIIGIGTRYTDFTTASRTVFQHPNVQFVNINVKAFDAAKHAATMVVADARTALETLAERWENLTGGASTAPEYRVHAAQLWDEWEKLTRPCFEEHPDQDLPAQTEIFGALNTMMGENDILINAAGSMPGDLQALWKARTPLQYHLEYGYSCMGYEIPAAFGTKLAAPESEVVAIVGDGTYQMAPQEIATLVQEDVKAIFVILQNHGWSSIGSLSESHGSQRFGTKYRMRNQTSGQLDGGLLPMDIAANLASYGIDVQEVSTTQDFRQAFARAQENPKLNAIVVNTNLYGPNPPGIGWWDVPVSQVSSLESTAKAYEEYAEKSRTQRHYL